MVAVEVLLDAPQGVEIRGYERVEEGHAFEVSWELPQSCTCQKCGHSGVARIEYAGKVQVIRDLEVWGQPGFFVYRPPYHRCERCHYRQWLSPPFKRKHVTYTYRFEEQVVQMLIGSTEEEVARRLGISAEMVAAILRHRLGDEQPIEPERVITDLGIDEISLKKRHKLYVTILTDLSDPRRPRVLAVAQGRDRAAAEACLRRLTPKQRQQVRTHRTDMSPAYTQACAELLPSSQNCIDRFHVAQKLGKIVDDVRKKDPRLQAGAFEAGAEEVPLGDVGVSHAARGAH